MIFPLWGSRVASTSVQEIFRASVLREGKWTRYVKKSFEQVEYYSLEIVKALSRRKSRRGEAVVKVTWESRVVVRLWEKR
jgi:hypothetical protein